MMERDAVFCFVLACQLDQRWNIHARWPRVRKERRQRGDPRSSPKRLFLCLVMSLSLRLHLSVLFDPHS